MLRTAASYTDPIEAMIVCGRLRAEGIEAQIVDQHTVLAYWQLRQALGGVKVKVPFPQLAEARDSLRELDRGGFVLSGEVMPAPYRESRSSRLAYLSLFLFGIPLPWWRRHRAD
jgi:hypothetical protein